MNGMNRQEGPEQTNRKRKKKSTQWIIEENSQYTGSNCCEGGYNVRGVFGRRE